MFMQNFGGTIKSINQGIFEKGILKTRFVRSTLSFKMQKKFKSFVVPAASFVKFPFDEFKTPF